MPSVLIHLKRVLTSTGEGEWYSIDADETFALLSVGELEVPAITPDQDVAKCLAKVAGEGFNPGGVAVADKSAFGWADFSHGWSCKQGCCDGGECGADHRIRG